MKRSIERLEEISEIRNNQRKLETDDDDDDNNFQQKLNISNEDVNLDALDVHIIGEPELETLPDLVIDDIELLD